MKLDTPYERIQELIGLLEHDPSVEQVTGHLSKQLDPYGEVSGIGWTTLGANGDLQFGASRGMPKDSELSAVISITDDHPLAKALRTEKLLLVDLTRVGSEYLDVDNQDEMLAYFTTGVVMPLNDKTMVSCLLTTPYPELDEFAGYFECMRLVLALWVNKMKFGATDLSHKSEYLEKDLTGRQVQILEMIKDGSTNAAIGLILGFSESLIRQESIIIYRKLGVDGRRELVGNDHHQTFTLRGED